MKFLVLKGESSYGVLRRFADEASEALKQLGHVAEIYDIYDKAKKERTLEEIKDYFDAILSFNGIGSENHATNNGQSRAIFDITDIPFISWMVDHPAYHHKRLTSNIPKRVSLCVNQEHCELIKQAGFTGKNFVLLAGAMGTLEEPKDYRKKKYQATLAATWMGNPVPFWENSYDAALGRIVEEAINRLIYDATASPFLALSNAALNHGFSIQPGPQIFNILCGMLNFIRSLDRVRTIRALANSELPVNIVGSGWEAYTGPRGKLNFSSNQDTTAMLETYRDSKVVFNFNAANGASERAFAGMIAGSAVLSDFSEALNSITNHGKDILFFDRSKPGDVAQKLGELIESDIGETIARNSRESVLREHLWLHRIDQLQSHLTEQQSEQTKCQEVA